MKRNAKSALSIFAASAVLALTLAGCGGGNNASTDTSAPADNSGSEASTTAVVSGTVSTNGSTSMEKVIGSLKEQFQKDNDGKVTVSYDATGSGAGIEAVSNGTTDIGLSSRALKDEETSAGLTGTTVALDGIAVIVNADSQVSDLSVEQIGQIFSGQITNWKEVGGDDAKIVVLNRKAGSGTRATFEAAVFGDEAVDFKGDAELDKSGDVQTQMGSTDNAISYLDFSHFDDSKFNAIKVEGVEPKSANVTDDSFKIWATEHMYCAKDADEATKAFLEFMLSDDVQGKLVEEQGFIPVSAMKVVKDASGKVSAK